MDKSDRRVIVVTLTKQGEQVTEQAEEAFSAVMKDLMDIWEKIKATSLPISYSRYFATSPRTRAISITNHGKEKRTHDQIATVSQAVSTDDSGGDNTGLCPVDGQSVSTYLMANIIDNGVIKGDTGYIWRTGGHAAGHPRRHHLRHHRRLLLRQSRHRLRQGIRASIFTHVRTSRCTSSTR